jgi:O-acetyl-ADP-ribose deacetylase (regulator of RNase III)
MMEIKLKKGTLVLIRGDITKETTDAIVNAANKTLLGGGGVDGAIHRAGGSEILKECKKIGGCETGQAVLTTGGKLKTRYVIHTVGPIYQDGQHNESVLLKNAYTNSIKVAATKKIKSLSFPSISTGAYGYPVDEAARIALTCTRDFLNTHDIPELIRFVLYDERTYNVYEKVLKEII